MTESLLFIFGITGYCKKSLTFFRFGIHPIPYPAILGTSFVGTVERFGANVTQFEVNDRVAVNRPSRFLGDPRFGAFQKHALASVSSTAKLDHSVPLQSAAAIISNLAAVVSALSVHLKLERPALADPTLIPFRGKKVLIHGGSSSCGGLAVKYVIVAGYNVITTSSPQNHAFVASLNPTHIIDHTLPASEILEALQFHGPYDAIFDTIGLAPVTNIFRQLLIDTGGEYNTLIPMAGDEEPLPSNIARKFAAYYNALEEAHEELSQWFYNACIPRGLAEGWIVPTRQVNVEGGLGGVQGALDKMGAGGISGHKPVMAL